MTVTYVLGGKFAPRRCLLISIIVLGGKFAPRRYLLISIIEAADQPLKGNNLSDLFCFYIFTTINADYGIFILIVKLVNSTVCYRPSAAGLVFHHL